MAIRERTSSGHTDSGELAGPGAPVTPVALMQIATGFWAFKTLAAAHELDLFTRLAGGAETTAQALARELGIEQRPAEMLLTGCASLGLLEGGRHGYRNTALSERFLVPRHPVLLRRPGDDVRPPALLGVGEAHGGDPHQPADDMGSGARALHVRARGPGGARDLLGGDVVARKP